MPDPHASEQSAPAAAPQTASTPPALRRGWPLWLRIGLAAVLLAFVWSPFLAMLARLSRVAPSLQPTGGSSNFTPPQAAPAPAVQGSAPGSAGVPPAPAPSP